MTNKQLDKAPENSLPTWSDCERIIDTPKETALHRFIYEYDDADTSNSDWFMHRLELVIQEARKRALEEAISICKDFKGGGSNGIQAARVCAHNIEELLK